MVGSTLLSQGLLRVAALGFPLIVILGVRHFGASSLESSFFALLTDVTLLVAFAKIGVDVYLPGCERRGGAVRVSLGYRRVYSGVVLALLGATGWLAVEDGYWSITAASSFVLCALALAEAGRLSGRFALFYFFKAPSTYVGALSASAIALYGGFAGASVTILVVACFAWHVNTLFRTGEADIGYRSFAVGAIVSVFVVVFGWKEAAVSRYFFGGESLPELVTYTRFALLVTFPFMLRNARVPLVMREHDEPRGGAAIERAIRSGRSVNVLWAVVAAGFVTAVAVAVEPEAATGVAMLMAGSCMLVAFGNLGACLIFLRAYGALAGAHVVAFVIYGVVLSLSSRYGSGDVVFTIALAALCSQLALCWCMHRSVMKLRHGSAERPSTTIGDTVKGD